MNTFIELDGIFFNINNIVAIRPNNTKSLTDIFTSGETTVWTIDMPYKQVKQYIESIFITNEESTLRMLQQCGNLHNFQI